MVKVVVLEIISVLQDDFIIDLRKLISNEILKSQSTGLEKFLGCKDDFEISTDPYIQILLEHTKVSVHHIMFHILFSRGPYTLTIKPLSNTYLNLLLFQEFDDISDDAENTIPESHLISLVKKLEEEVIIEDIPRAPIIVYLEDKETKAIIGIKIKD